MPYDNAQFLHSGPLGLGQRLAQAPCERHFEVGPPGGGLCSVSSDFANCASFVGVSAMTARGSSTSTGFQSR